MQKALFSSLERFGLALAALQSHFPSHERQDM
jgi:hypothetical protein